MKKYFVYFIAQFLTLVSLGGYYVVGNHIFCTSATAQTFFATSRTMGAKSYVYVQPLTGVLGVLIEAMGLFLFCVCFGFLARYCKLHLSLTAKHISFGIFGIAYIMGALFLFTNNFSMLNRGNGFAVKEIWANAINFFVCFVSCVLGFCTMYKIKNQDNHLIY